MHHIDVVAPHLVDFADDDLADFCSILGNDVVLLDLAYTLAEHLCSHRDHTAAEVLGEVLQVQLGKMLVPQIIFLTTGIGFLDRDLQVRVLDLFDHFAKKVDLDIPLLHIDDDIELRFQTVFLPNHLREGILDDTLEQITVDIFLARHFGKRIDDVLLAGA